MTETTTKSALSGDGALITLPAGGTVEVKFTFRNIARIEEAFGSHAEFVRAGLHQPYLTVATVLTVTQCFKAKGEPATLDEVLDNIDGLDIEAARDALRDAYIRAVPWYGKEPDGGGEADPPPAT